MAGPNFATAAAGKRAGVSRLTEAPAMSPYKSAVTHREAAMLLVRTFAQLTTEAIVAAMVVAAALMLLGLPFFLALASPFLGR
jgi:hypothetical protein